MSTASFRTYVMAVNRVEERLKRATAALDGAGIRYAVIGGNAVAAWVAGADPSATRSTKDVDLLVSRSDLDVITRSLQSAGFRRENLRNLVMFIDPLEPSRHAAVHLVWADQRVRPSYLCEAPSLDEAVRAGQGGFLLLELHALVRMKLTSLRAIDRVHRQDMLSVGLIDRSVRDSLPSALKQRLAEVENAAESEEH